MRRFLTLAALVVAALTISVASASASYCGPEFANKAEAIAYYHTAEGAKRLPSLTRELRAHGFMHRDQSVWAFLNSARVVVVITPQGYTLNTNTSCDGFTYVPYSGLYVHSHKAVLAVIDKTSVKKIGKPKQFGTPVSKVVKVQEEKVPQPDGSTQVYKVETIDVTTRYHQEEKVCTTYSPFEKGYCRNFVTGRPFQICKTKTVTTQRVQEEVKKTLVRTEPAPKTPEIPKEIPKEKECPSTNSGNVSGIGNIQGSCDTAKVECTGAESCKTIIYNECTSAASGGTGTSGTNSGNATSSTTCESKTPTCQEKGEVGSYPSCHPPTCEELGNCEVPKCKPGETGTYPNCVPPPPPPILTVTMMNDVEAGYFSENFCAETELPGHDTGTLTIVPTYGNFGSLGKKLTFTVQGTAEKCPTYYAPTEVPPGGKDTMEVRLVDDTTGDSVPPNIQQFRIDPKETFPSE